MALPEHSKIINKIAGRTLKPAGIQRQGRSRTWFEDNGWFTTFVEFQPFSGKKGTFLNVGVNFHWVKQDYWSFDIGYRISGFIEYVNEEQFSPEIEKLSKVALKKVLEYRESLSDLVEAKNTILANSFTSEILWGSYHKGVICGLNGDFAEMESYFNRILEMEKIYPDEKELGTVVSRLTEQSGNLESFKNTILSFIKDSRTLKKLPEIDLELR
jgi:hypothetical protein